MAYASLRCSTQKHTSVDTCFSCKKKLRVHHPWQNGRGQTWICHGSTMASHPTKDRVKSWKMNKKS